MRVAADGGLPGSATAAAAEQPAQGLAPWVRDRDGTLATLVRLHENELRRVTNAFNALCHNLPAACRDLHEAKTRFERDIAARRPAETVLLEREARLRRLVDANVIGVLFWRQDGEVTYVNDAFLDIIGYRRGSLPAAEINWMAMMPPEYVPVDRRAMEELRARARCKPYEKEYVRPDGTHVPVLLAGALFEGSDNEGVAYVIDLGERRQAEERRQLLVNELNHRVKNTLATVIGVAKQTLRTAETPQEFVQSFEDRLHALSQAHNLLTQTSWRGATVMDVLRLELAPHVGGEADRYIAAGDEVQLSPKAAVMLGMAFHELATNAVKYGALSASTGQVGITFFRSADGTPGGLKIVWQERGGPPVHPPRRRGFGSRLLQEGIEYELGGTVTLGFKPEGLRCTIELPPNCILAD
jgi:PAS domain S-box-containing protein